MDLVQGSMAGSSASTSCGAGDAQELLPGSPEAGLAKQNGVLQTGLLVVANCAGAGILSMPKAINQAGLVAGSVLVVAAAVLSAYTADILGRCYSIIQQRKQDGSAQESGAKRQQDTDGGEAPDQPRGAAEEQTASFFARSPYAAIGQEAAGAAGAGAVTAAQVLTQFCVMVLFFLISGVNLNKLVPGRSSLFFSLVCCAGLTPLMLLRPGHVWATAVFAIVASVVLVAVVVILCATNAPHDPHTPMPPVTFATFGTAFGVILFGFGGHAILPALQATMADPTPARFRRAIVWSFTVCTAMYLSTSISAVATLGGTVGDDILTNFSGYVNDFGLVAVTSHLLFAAVTVHIPLGQIVDHYAGAADCSARQVAARVVTMGLVAATIWLVGGNFYCVIGLVGGTCNNAMIFIFPPWFYLRLVAAEKRTPAMWAMVVGVMTIGTAGMVSALIGAVDTC